MLEEKNILITIESIYFKDNLFFNMKIMKKQILSKFKHYRNSIIKSLFEIVKESPNKKILLDENPVDLRIDDDGLIVNTIYKMLSIKKDTLIVHYLSGE